MEYDIFVYNGTVLTLNRNSDVHPNGAVGISGTTLKYVDALPPEAPLPAANQYIDASSGIIMPGLVNTHTHLPMTLFRGMADDLPLDVWLQEHIFPAEASQINPTAVARATAVACAELIRNGTTTVCDGYFFEDTVAETLRRFGLRAVLGQGILDFPSPDVPDPRHSIANARNYLEKWVDRSELIHPSLFCHAPYTCSEKTLREARSLADDLDVLFQIHVAETESERLQFLSEKGKSPVAYLEDAGVLNRRTLAAHAIWVDETDIGILADRGVGISHNPESNMKLASGIAPVPSILEAGIAVGLGTDGCASNNDLDLFSEMGMAARLHKVFTEDPATLPKERILEMATIQGARVLGLDHITGSLEVGKQADLIVIDTGHPRLTPCHCPISQLVFAANGGDVRDVIVGGSCLMAGRIIQTIDL